MEEMKAEVTAFRPIFRLLCCRRGLRKIFRGLRPRNLTPKKLSRAVKNLPLSLLSLSFSLSLTFSLSHARLNVLTNLV